MSDALEGIVAFLGTLAVHASALLGAVWLAEKALVLRSDAVRELAWRAALFGSLGSAAIQTWGGIAPLGGAWPALSAAMSSGTPMIGAVELPTGGEAPAALAIAPLLALAWIAVTGLGLMHLGWNAANLRRRLRLVPADADVVRRARHMALRLGVRGVRVSLCAAAVTPMLFGLWRHELCLPPRARVDLDPAAFDAALAHELAHARRRDPLWALLLGVVMRLAFWHPLVWIARRRLLALAEVRCDELARQTAPGAALALARALLAAAEWLRDRRVPGCAGIPAMAAVRSELAGRVRRLLLPTAAASPSPVLVRCAAALVLAGAPVVLPGAGAPPPPPVAAPATSGLPAPLAEIAAEVAGLRGEFDAVRGLVHELELADDPMVAPLLQAIDQRLRRVEARLARAVAAAMSEPSFTGPLGPAHPIRRGEPR